MLNKICPRTIYIKLCIYIYIYIYSVFCMGVFLIDFWVFVSSLIKKTVEVDQFFINQTLRLLFTNFSVKYFKIMWKQKINK